MKYLTSDLSFMRMCAYVFLVCVCLCFTQEASAYGYSQGSYSYSQGSYYSQSSYSYSYSQGSYTYSQGSYSYSQSSYSYSYSQGSYSYSQGSYSSSYSQGSYSSGYYSQGSYSSKADPIGNGTTWQEVQNFSKPSTCTGLCAGAKAVTSAATAVGSTVKESADWLVSAGSKFLGAAKKAAGIETPAYTQLPDSSTNPRGDVAEKPTVTTPTKTFEDIKEAEEERKIQAQGGTTVIAPGLNALQQKTLNTAKAAGLNVSNKAVEAVVLLSLEKNGNDPTKAVEALTKIQEETGADLNRAISTNIALGSSLCGNSQCEAADKIREIIDVDQTELAQKMASIDKIKNPVVTTTQPAATTPTKTFQDIKDAEEERIIKAQQGTETTKPVATTPTKSDPVGTSPTWAELQEFNKPADTPNPTFQDIKDAEEERKIAAQGGTAPAKPAATAPAYDPFAPGGEATQAVLDSNKAGAEKVVSNLIGFVGGLFGAKPAPVPPADIPTVTVTPAKTDPVGTSPTWAELQEFNKPAVDPTAEKANIEDLLERTARVHALPDGKILYVVAVDPNDRNKNFDDHIVELIVDPGANAAELQTNLRNAIASSEEIKKQQTILNGGVSPSAPTVTTKSDPVGTTPTWADMQEFNKPAVKPVTVSQKQVDLTGMFGDTLSTAFYPGTAQKDLVDTELITPVEFKDVKVAVFQPKDEVKPVRVVSVPAKSVKTISLYDTAKIEENPSTSSFVDDDTYTSSNLKSNAFTEVKDDLKAILPTGQEIYAKHEGFPVMSPGELALVGKLDLTRGGKFDQKEELAALELALRGEIPADVRERIANGTATEQDLIELTGIITVLVNRAVAQNSSIEHQVTGRDLQITSVTQVKASGKTAAEELGFQPKLLTAVEDLMSGKHAKEFGLTNIEPDELAYAADYYSPAALKATDAYDTAHFAQTGDYVPAEWDINHDQKNYTSAGGHVFGNALNADGKAYTYKVAGKDLGLDLGFDEDTQIITTSLQTMPVRNVQSVAVTPGVPMVQPVQTAVATQDPFGSAVGAIGDFFGGILGLPEAPEVMTYVAPAETPGITILDSNGKPINPASYTVVTPSVLDYASGIVPVGLGVTPVFTDFDSPEDIYAKYDQAGVLKEEVIESVRNVRVVESECSTCTGSILNKLSESSRTGIVTIEVSDSEHVFPIDGGMIYGANSDFGYGRGRLHAGNDYYSQDPNNLSGTDVPVKSVIAGTVIKSQIHNGYGYTIDVLGEDGLVYRYAHVSGTDANGNPIAVGSKLGTGEAFTYVTGTGTNFGQKVTELGSYEAAEAYFNEHGWEASGTTRPHLHFEVRTAENSFGASNVVDPQSVFDNIEKGVTYTAGTDLHLHDEDTIIVTSLNGTDLAEQKNLMQAFDYDYGVINPYTPSIDKFSGGTGGTVNIVTAEPPRLTENQETFLDIAEKYGVDRNNDTEVAAIVLIEEAMMKSDEDLKGKTEAQVFEEQLAAIKAFASRDPDPLTTVIGKIASGEKGLIEGKIIEGLGMTPAQAQQAISTKVAELNTPTETQVVVTSENGSEVTMGRQLFEGTFNVDTTQTTPTTETTPKSTITTDKELGETVLGFVKGVGDAISGFFGSFTGKIDNTKPAESLVSSDSDNDSDPEPTPTPTPKSALDLTVKATAPTKSTNTEYRFKGELSRILSGSEDEYLTELQKNFSVNIENRLNIDFSCNGTVDTQKIFTLPYRSFSTQGTASTLFMSEYLEVTRTGSHCFYFDIDIKKVITESNEGNNQSNKFNFTVGE